MKNSNEWWKTDMFTPENFTDGLIKEKYSYEKILDFVVFDKTFDFPEYKTTFPEYKTTHRIVRFRNGFGASILHCFPCLKIGVDLSEMYNGFKNVKDQDKRIPYTIIQGDDLYELAVIKFVGNGYYDYNLCYDTYIANDVLKNVSKDDVETLLIRICHL